MKTLLRILISLLIMVWLGAVLFFPAVAAVAFHVLPHPAAGLVVRNCLLVLHWEGLIAGVLLLMLLALARAARVYGRPVIGAVLCTIAMLLLTAFSQFNVIPRMEADRIAAGGDIDKAQAGDPHHVEFDRLHAASKALEEGVLAAGLVMVVILGRPARQS